MSVEASLAARFSAVSEVIDCKWREGIPEWCRAAAPNHAVAMEITQLGLEEAWKEALLARVVTPRFESALSSWQRAHEEALRDWSLANGGGRS